MLKNYCMNCKKEVSKDMKICECGGNFFVFGDKFHYDKNGIVCDCGNNKFKMEMHSYLAHKSVNNYKCTKYGNVVGTVSYRDKADFMCQDGGREQFAMQANSDSLRN